MISMHIPIFFVSKVAYQFYEVTMTITIYGRDNCSYCKRAVELAKQLKGHGYGDYEYIDITTAGIDKEKLSEIVGKPVETIPGTDRWPTDWRIHRTGCIRQHPLI